MSSSKISSVYRVGGVLLIDIVNCFAGETPHHCEICGKKYTRKEHLANHMRSHTNDTPFRCEICTKSFTRKEHFTNHIMWHTGKKNQWFLFLTKSKIRRIESIRLTRLSKLAIVTSVFFFIRKDLHSFTFLRFVFWN